MRMEARSSRLAILAEDPHRPLGVPERPGQIRRHARHDQSRQDPSAELAMIRCGIQGPLQIFGRRRRAGVPFHLREQPEPLHVQRQRRSVSAGADGQPASGRHIAGLQGRERMTERSAREIVLPAGGRKVAGSLEELGR